MQNYQKYLKENGETWTMTGDGLKVTFEFEKGSEKSFLEYMTRRFSFKNVSFSVFDWMAEGEKTATKKGSITDMTVGEIAEKLGYELKIEESEKTVTLTPKDIKTASPNVPKENRNEQKKGKRRQDNRAEKKIKTAVAIEAKNKQKIKNKENERAGLNGNTENAENYKAETTDSKKNKDDVKEVKEVKEEVEKVKKVDPDKKAETTETQSTKESENRKNTEKKKNDDADKTKEANTRDVENGPENVSVEENTSSDKVNSAEEKKEKEGSPFKDKIDLSDVSEKSKENAETEKEKSEEKKDTETKSAEGGENEEAAKKRKLFDDAADEIDAMLSEKEHEKNNSDKKYSKDKQTENRTEQQDFKETVASSDIGYLNSMLMFETIENQEEPEVTVKKKNDILEISYPRGSTSISCITSEGDKYFQGIKENKIYFLTELKKMAEENEKK